MTNDWEGLGFSIEGPDVSVEQAEELIESGDPEGAALLLGEALRAGWMPDEADLSDELIDCVVVAVREMGSPSQSAHLAEVVRDWLLLDGGDVSDAVISWLKEAAEQGAAAAPGALGLALSQRRSRESHERALAWFDTAVKSGDPTVADVAVQFLLSSADELDGNDLRQRLEAWSRVGCAEASRTVAWLAVSEFATTKARGDALMWMNRAVQQGSPGAPCELALLLLAESPPNTTEARSWLAKCRHPGDRALSNETLLAACDGDPDASHAVLGLLRDHGLVAESSLGRSDPVAAHWIGKASLSSDLNVLSLLVDSALENLQMDVALTTGERLMRLARETEDDDEIVRAGLTLAPVHGFAGRIEAARQTLEGITDAYNSLVQDHEPPISDLLDAISPAEAARERGRLALAAFDRSPDALLFIALSHSLDGRREETRRYLDESSAADQYTMASPILVYLQGASGDLD